MTPDTLDLSEKLSPSSNQIAPTLTYRVDFVNKRIVGTIEKEESVLQFVQKALATDKYAYEIYNWNYGNEINSLIGKPYEYIVSEIPRIIKEALMTDDRILDAVNFVFSKKEIDSITITFDVVHIYGTTTFTGEVAA